MKWTLVRSLCEKNTPGRRTTLDLNYNKIPVWKGIYPLHSPQ